MPDLTVRTSAGIVVAESDVLVVVLDDGTRITPLWPSVPVTVGDRVQVVLIDQVAHIIGPVTTTPRPTTGTVTGAASTGLIPVGTSDGTVRARYTGTAPAIGTLVALIWQGTTALLLPGTLAALTGDTDVDLSDVPTLPPAPPTTGTLLVTAQGSGTWRTGGWGWATSTDILQGSRDAGQDNRGGWWYGDAPRVLAGRTITGARLRLGARLRVDASTTPIPLHTYLTTDTTRPTEDYTRTAGPHDLTVPASAPATWHDLPTSWGQILADTGGGIGVQGAGYVGVTGTATDPQSGLIALDWTR